MQITKLLPIIVLAACSNTNPESSKGFELKGKLTNTHTETIFLLRVASDGMKKIDSASVDEKGEFTMKPFITETGFYQLKVAGKNFATFVFSPDEKVTVTGDITNLGNTYTVEGSADSKLFWDVNQASAKNYARRDSIEKYFQQYITSVNNNPEKVDSAGKALEKPYTEIINIHKSFLEHFIESNPTSLSSLAAIQQLKPEDSWQTFVKLDEGLFKKFPKSEYVKGFHESVESQRKLAFGEVAPEIEMKTPEDKTLKLSSLKGKVVLIDFWASWCGPCRKENPNVVAAYNKYKDKGFTIYSVSLDKDKDKWQDAIKKDNLSWTNHVCDFMFWQSPVVKLYNFSGIPTNVLIDRDGKIIGKALRGEELEKKLEEIFK